MSNLNLNKVIIAGHISQDFEVKQTQSGLSVVSLTVAVNRPQKDSEGKSITDFISVTAWRQAAETVGKYFKKGSAICVSGAIQTRSWTDQNGQKRYATDIVADNVYFIDSKADMEQGVGAAQIPAEQPHFEEINDDDLPF